MAKKDKEVKEQQPEAEKVEGPAVQEPEKAPEVNPFEEKYNAEHDSYLRLAADYDNYRKRTAKEKEQSYSNGKADTILKLLPIYDNLERAMNQDTEDAAYKKGVEMTMNQLKSVLEKLGITEIDALGKPFDPALHNAVMHVEDENFGENTVAEVFQAGFMLGEKVIRFAMVKVAN